MDQPTPVAPPRIETQRLFLRCYEPGDLPWFYEMCRKNRLHLARFEPDNLIMEIKSEGDARQALQDVAAGWIAGSHLFLGAFHRPMGEFVAQVYIGVVNRDLPEFQVGYFADVDHEGQGYVTEAVRAILEYIFDDPDGAAGLSGV